MKVLLISHTCQSQTEGQPRARELASIRDLELTLLVPHKWKRYGSWRRAQRPVKPNFRLIEGKIIWPWSGPAQTYLHWYPALPRLLKQLQPDVIDLWEEPWSLVAAQTCFWRDRVCPAAKIVVETEQNVDKRLPPPFENFRSYVLKRADYLVGRNVESLEILRRKGYAGPARVVPNAVDVELFTRDAYRDQTRMKYDWHKRDFVVGYAGRLVESKGVFDLLSAFEKLDFAAKLVFIGDGEARAELEKRVPGNFRFLGAQPLEALPELFSALDCLVLPSRTTSSWKEQFGRVLIEAASCGVPVIGSDSGAIPEVIGAGEDALGLIFPEGDDNALAVALERLQNEPQSAQRLGTTGARRARAEFSWARVAAQLAEIYREL